MKLFSTPNIITRCRESKAYFRGLVVRAVEDAIILFSICVCIAGVCGAFTLLFRALGVE